MRKSDLTELLELEKKFKRKLTEAIQVTQDLAEAIERQDAVSIDMLLSIRHKSILEMQEVRSFIDLKRLDLDSHDLPRMDALLAGAAAEIPDERPVAEIIASNQRLLSQLLSMDRALNQKLCGANSVYA